MKKLIILRGHQGSGKSTYAKELIADFQNRYENAYTFEVSYDDTLTKQHNGNYDWTPENIGKAMQTAWNDFKEFIEANKKKDKNVLIVHSATNKTIKAFKKYVNLAKSKNYEIEIIRLSNFFQNTHNCSDLMVATAFLMIEQNPIEGEIVLPCTTPASGEILRVIENLRKSISPKINTCTNSYVTKEYLEFNQGKIIAKRSERYTELSVFKYSRRVFFDKDFDDAMCELRGLVLDDEFNIVIRPFIKTFNLSEREERNSKYPLRVKDDDRFNAVKKINGFLGCATYIDRDEFNNKSFNKKVLYSTTGSLDSKYADMAKRHLEKYEALFKAYPNHTFMFEIADENDPHIITEKIGEYLLSCRNVLTGETISPIKLKEIVKEMKKEYQNLANIIFPEVLENISFKELNKLNSKANHEGFVVYDLDFKEILFKLKSPYYLIIKFLGRKKDLSKLLNELKEKGVTGHFVKQYSIEEEYFPLLEHLYTNIDEVVNLDEQGKIAYIKKFLNNTNR